MNLSEQATYIHIYTYIYIEIIGSHHREMHIVSESQFFNLVSEQKPLQPNDHLLFSELKQSTCVNNF